MEDARSEESRREWIGIEEKRRDAMGEELERKSRNT